MELKLCVLYYVVLLAGRGQSDPEIYDCPSGTKAVTEDTDVKVNCGFNSNGIQWLFSVGNIVRFIGECWRDSCSSWYPGSFAIQQSRQNEYTSTLTIYNITRNQELYFGCGDPATIKASWCKLRVIAYPSYTDGSCNIRIVDWSVIGSCAVERMYASDNNYRCFWKRNISPQMFGGFGGTLQGYTASNNRNYTRGNCSFTQSMLVIEGEYTFSMTVFPGTAVYYESKIDIAQPEGLTHDCPNQVLEGSSFLCQCTTQNSGNPPARITWDGRQNETLQLTDIRRQSQGDQFTCRLIWGPKGSINDTTLYTLSVAYGPLSVFVNKTVETSAKKSEIVRLTCTAIDVYPSATFAWNVSCHNQTDNTNTSTCFFNSTQTIDNLAVTCTAHNKDFANGTSSSTYVLQIAASNEAHSSAVAESVNGGLIGGIIAAVAGIIIVAVVIAYIIKRRKGTLCKKRGALLFLHGARKLFQSNSAPSRPDPFVHKPKDQPTIQRHAAPSGDLYTIAGTTTTAGRVGDDYASVCKMVENEVYEPEGDVRLQASPAGHEMNRSGEKETPTVKPKPAKAAMTSSFSVSGTGYMNVTEFSTDSGLGVYHIVPWAVPSDTTPFACDTSAPENSEDEYNVLKFDDGSVHDDPGDSYNHLQLT